MESIVHDLRYAVRALKRSPGFALIAVLTLALGIGATTTIFSVVNAVLLKPPPGVRGASELVRLYRVAEDGSSFHEVSYPNYLDYRSASSGLSDLAATAVQGVVLSDREEPEAMFGLLVSSNFFGLLGVQPALGRFFTADDGTAAAEREVVLSHRTWARRFGRDPSILGRTIHVNRVSFTVVGITQEGFRGPNSMVDIGVWLPMESAPQLATGRDLHSRADTWIDAFGRRRPDASTERVEAALNRVSANLRTEFPNNNPDYGVDVWSYRPIGTRAFGPAMGFSVFLFLIAGTVLLIACLNVGSMLLVRATQRGREMTMRLALGASRRRLVRQLLTESVLLFSIGGAGGVLVALYVTRLLSAYQLPVDLPLVLDFTPDSRALAFSLAVALVAGLAFGLAPALHITHGDPQTNLRAGSAVGSVPRARLRSVFVVTQVAGSTLLLIGAGLFARGLVRAGSVDLGFEPDGVHALSMELDNFAYDVERASSFFRDLMERVAELPGVESVGATNRPPVTLGGGGTEFRVVGRPPANQNELPRTDFATITPGYLETFRIPVIDGRRFSEADRGDAVRVAIVNETFARRNWPEDSPLGKRIELDAVGDDPLEIVGVARNAKYRTLTENPRPMVYVPYEQWPSTSLVVLVRLQRAEVDIAGQLRGVVHELDDALPIDANVAYTDLMDIAMLPSRAAALFTTVFGAVGLLLAALGLYGVLAFAVNMRTREIGIRMALGARAAEMRVLVIRGGMKLVGVGLAIGFLIAGAVMRLMRGLLYGLSPTDPLTFGSIAVLLTGVAVAAAYLPARRATQVDPVKALRAD
ncbi:MAG: ABC transporter permease [Gemmatimonadales bacterium]